MQQGTQIGQVNLGLHSWEHFAPLKILAHETVIPFACGNVCKPHCLIAIKNKGVAFNHFEQNPFMTQPNNVAF